MFDYGRYFKGTSALPKAFADYQAAIEEEAAAEKVAAASLAEYNKSKADYDAAVAQNDGTVDANTRVKDEAGKLKTIVEKLEKADTTTHGLVSKYLSTDKLKSLDDFFTSIDTDVGSGEAPKGASKASTGVIFLSGVVADAQKAVADGKAALTAPLLIEQSQEQLKSEGASLRVAAWKAEIELKRQMLKVAMDEVVTLSSARRILTKAGEGMKPGAFDSLPFVLAASQPATEEPVKWATLMYLDVVQKDEADRNKLKYRLIDSEFDQSLASDALTLKRWESLITFTTGQVASFYATGVDVDALYKIVQLLGLGWIGHGTNK